MKSTRRQVGGILQIIAGAISASISLIAFLRTGVAMQRYETLVTFAFSAMILGIGIYYTRTFNQAPIKKIEYILVGILIVLMLLCESESAWFRPANIFIIMCVIAYCVGAPTKKGYKNMPFVK